MPTKVAHVVLAARDPQVSAAFYTDVLGMQRVWDFDQLDMVFFSFGERDHDIALIKAPEHAPLGNRTRSGCENLSLAITSASGVSCRHGNTDGIIT